MKTGTLHLSRPVLLLEMLLCFVPLTLLGLAVISVTLAGKMTFPQMLLYLSATAIGPVGLVAALRLVSQRHRMLDRVMTLLLWACAAWAVLAFLLLAATGSAVVGEYWRELLLLALFPALGTVHLIFIGRREEEHRISA